GRAHASLEQVELVAVCDVNETRGREIAYARATRFVRDYRELIDQVEAVSVATPTVSHCEISRAFLEAGVHVLVEKPIARTLDEADEMIRAAESKNLVLQTGHIERFNPAFVALRRRIERPRFFEAHRMGVFTPRSLDVDVVMDLMVHELDIIASLVRSDVVKLEAVGVPILTPKIDLANARLEFADGCVANITASRVPGERGGGGGWGKGGVFKRKEYYWLDWAEQQGGALKLIPPKAAGALPEISAEGLLIEKREPLLAEIESFVAAVQSRTPPEVGGTE